MVSPLPPLNFTQGAAAQANLNYFVQTSVLPQFFLECFLFGTTPSTLTNDATQLILYFRIHICSIYARALLGLVKTTIVADCSYAEHICRNMKEYSRLAKASTIGTLVLYVCMTAHLALSLQQLGSLISGLYDIFYYTCRSATDSMIRALNF